MMVFIFPAEARVFAFFGVRSPSKTHCFDYSLVSGMHHCIHVSSTIAKRRWNSSRFRFNSAKHVFEVVSRFRLLSGVNKGNTHRADGFLRSKISRIWLTRSLELTAISTNSRAVRQYKRNGFHRGFLCGSRLDVVHKNPTCRHCNTPQNQW